MVLEIGSEHAHLKKVQMIEILTSHDDFQMEKNKVERLLVRFEQHYTNSILNLTLLVACWVELKRLCPIPLQLLLYRLAEHSDTSVGKCLL